MKSIIFVLISLTFYSCMPEKQSTDFTLLKSKAGTDNQGISKKDFVPVQGIGEDEDDIDFSYDNDDYYDVDDKYSYDDDDEYNYDEDEAGEDPVVSLKNCDFDLGITNAQTSKTKIIIGNQQQLLEHVEGLNPKELDYITEGINGSLNYSQSNFVQTSHSKSLDMGFAGNGKYKVTSSKGDNYLFYSKGEFIFDTTSSNSDRLVIMAKNKMKISTTNYNIKEAVLLLETQSKDIKVCIRETGASSINLNIMAGPEATVNVVSVGTSFKNSIVESTISGALVANQYWKGTTFNSSQLTLINHASLMNSVEVGFTSFQGSNASIEQSGTSASAYIHGTSLFENSKISLENNAETGTYLDAAVIHGTDKNVYRAYSGAILKIGETEIIEGKQQHNSFVVSK
jgi:hypothetical protein